MPTQRPSPQTEQPPGGTLGQLFGAVGLAVATGDGALVGFPVGPMVGMAINAGPASVGT